MTAKHFCSHPENFCFLSETVYGLEKNQAYAPLNSCKQLLERQLLLTG